FALWSQPHLTEEARMRNLIMAAVILVAGPALAEKPAAKGEAAAAAAKATLDKSDAAFNSGDAKALSAMLDSTFFGAGPFISARWPDVATAKVEIEKMVTAGGRMTRDALT